MNNKRLGTEFEQQMCRLLKADGWWVHFLSPDASGAQPFDLIAVQGRRVIAADCKTSSVPIFKIDRLEDNQISAFEYWRLCGNGEPLLFIKYAERVYVVPYLMLKQRRRIDLREFSPWCKRWVLK